MRVWTAILTTCFFPYLTGAPSVSGLPAYLYFFQPEWLSADIELLGPRSAREGRFDYCFLVRFCS